jgi:hypothetical protein
MSISGPGLTLLVLTLIEEESDTVVAGCNAETGLIQEQHCARNSAESRINLRQLRASAR